MLILPLKIFDQLIISLVQSCSYLATLDFVSIRLPTQLGALSNNFRISVLYWFQRDCSPILGPRIGLAV